MKLIKICSVLFLIILSGCSLLSGIGKVRFNVAVDSFASATASSNKTYLLLPGNQGITEADLEFQEYAAYFKRVMAAKGYVYTDLKEEADLAVYLAYGIGDPETFQYAYTLPEWGHTGYLTSRTYVTQTDNNGEKTYKAYTTYTPTYGFRGYSTYLDTETAYRRFAVVTAYDYEQFKKDEKEVQLWKTTITSMGASDDLRRVFPVLMAASEPYLATDTGHKVYVSLYEDDDAVLKVKGNAAEEVGK